MNIEELRQTLQREVLNVTFTKKNGDVRLMHCTTMQEHIPFEPSKYQGPASETVVTVWDVQNQGWRSFKFDSIISVDTDYFNYTIEK